MRQSIIRVIRKMGFLGSFEKFRYWQSLFKYRKPNQLFKEKYPDFIVPPTFLAYDAYSAPSWDYYKSSGEETAQFLSDKIKSLSSETYNQTGKIKVCEWGCGPARVIRHLPNVLGDNFEVYGTDYNTDSIKWCTDTFPQITFKVNQLNPPLPFPDNHLDFIYCISVFTHLSTEVGKQWIKELRRVIKPDGVLIFTTGGKLVSGGLATTDKEQFEKEGYLVRSNVKEGSRIYSTMYRPDYVKKELIKGFDLVDFQETGFPRMNQDLWIVKKNMDLAYSE